MHKRIILLIFITLSYAAEITNIQVQQRTDGTGIIDVTYDLIDSEGIYPSFNVSIEMDINEEGYTSLNSADVSGDIGENVIPGEGRSIQIIAPEDTFSNNVIIKIIASATVVSGELPFTMISISSIEGVSTYQEDTVDYNFQLMQYELTNADLVTFLETYDFALDEDGNSSYNCNEYTQYFNSGDNTDNDCGNCYGCTDGYAANYNPDATISAQCIYQNQIGCTDVNAWNYGSDGNMAEYDDCSCFDFTESSYNWVTMPGCNWPEALEEAASWSSDVDYQYPFNVSDTVSVAINNKQLEINLCGNSNSLNYPHELIDEFYELMSTGHITEECWTLTGFDSCIEEDGCDQSYLDFPTDSGETDFGLVNIASFTTQHITHEGSSFVIESGAGSKPALLNYNNCVDAVIVGLLLEYYGLRFPTAGEWTKAARQDNDRCWPWMNNNCSNANELYCSSAYSCLSQEDYDACEESVSDTQLDCNNNCVLDNNTCQSDCGCDFGGDTTTDCDIYNEEIDEAGCENNADCSWFSNACVSTCYSCMMESDNYNSCIGESGGDSANPCNDGCPCCATCDQSGSGSSCDNDCLTECQLTQNGCYNDCNSYSNPWEYCGGQDMMECSNNYENCTDYNNTWGECEEINQMNLSELLENPSEYQDHSFLSDIYLNKFHNTYELNFWEGWDNQSLDLSDVGLYPEGLSPFGLYDMIGNAPEIIMHNNLLWLIGPTPEDEYVLSFCSNDNTMFLEGASENGSQAKVLTNLQGTTFNLYGLRLARTTQ